MKYSAVGVDGIYSAVGGDGKYSAVKGRQGRYVLHAGGEHRITERRVGSLGNNVPQDIWVGLYAIPLLVIISQVVEL